MILRTERLDLHPLPLAVLESLLAGDLDRTRALVPFRIDADSFADDDYVLSLRAEQLRADATELPWLYRGAVLRATGEVVGRAGFHAPPDPAGTVEIGYRVREQSRRQGFATEMVAGLLGWARTAGAARCLASTAPGNAASQAVLTGLAFVRTGEQVDDVDGLEWVFTRQPV